MKSTSQGKKPKSYRNLIKFAAVLGSFDVNLTNGVQRVGLSRQERSVTAEVANRTKEMVGSVMNVKRDL